MTLQEITAIVLAGSVFLFASFVILFLLERFYFDSSRWVSRILVKPLYRICFGTAVIGGILGLSLNVYVGMVAFNG